MWIRKRQWADLQSQLAGLQRQINGIVNILSIHDRKIKAGTWHDDFDKTQVYSEAPTRRFRLDNLLDELSAPVRSGTYTGLQPAEKKDTE